MHDLLHKSNRQHASCINSLWIFSTNRFTIQKTNQIYVSLGKTTTDLEVNLTERKKKDVSLAHAIDENAWKYPGPKCSRFFTSITKWKRWPYGQLVTLSIMLDYFSMCYMPPASTKQIPSISLMCKLIECFSIIICKTDRLVNSNI